MNDLVNRCLLSILRKWLTEVAVYRLTGMKRSKEVSELA